jgi:hypothetical protein
MNLSTFIVTSTLIAASTAVNLQAQETQLGSVPMQGGMVMPAIRYMTEHGHLMVTMPSEIPHLTPLEESHPDMHFHPTSPWYEDLDPDHQGKAFNRQYGFVMDGASDLLPLGTAIWIQLVSADHGLEAYTYRSISDDEQIWTPMFGTHDSSKIFEWDMRMFHPAFAALQGSGPLSADFEAFVVDLDSGKRRADIGGITFTLLWTAEHSDVVPALGISQKIVLSWPQPVGHYHLQSTTDLESGEWQPMHQTPVMIDGNATVILDHSYQGMFFRLVSHEEAE